MADPRANLRPGQMPTASDWNIIASRSSLDAQNMEKDAPGGGYLLKFPTEPKLRKADLSASGISPQKHSIVYANASLSGVSWSTTRGKGSVPYYTGDCKANTPRPIPVKPVLWNNDYVLVSTDGLPEGTCCKWDGSKLVACTEESEIEFRIDEIYSRTIRGAKASYAKATYVYQSASAATAVSTKTTVVVPIHGAPFYRTAVPAPSIWHTYRDGKSSTVRSFIAEKCMGYLDTGSTEVLRCRGDGKDARAYFCTGVTTGDDKPTLDLFPNYKGKWDATLSYSEIYSRKDEDSGVTYHRYVCCVSYKTSPWEYLSLDNNGSVPLYKSAIDVSNISTSKKYKNGMLACTKVEAEEVRFPVPTFSGMYFYEYKDNVFKYMIFDNTEKTEKKENPTGDLAGKIEYSNDKCYIKLGIEDICGIGSLGEVSSVSVDADGFIKLTFTPQTDGSAAITTHYLDILAPEDSKYACTTNKEKAAIKYLPAVSKSLDCNEWLQVGEEVEYIEKTATYHYLVRKDLCDSYAGTPSTVDKSTEINYNDHTYYRVSDSFTYAEVTPPDSYHEELVGTPKCTIMLYEFTKPEDSDVESCFCEADDLYVDGSNVTTTSTTNEPMTARVVEIALDENGNPVIREPFGVFNDCSNEDSLGAFVRYDGYGRVYAYGCRLDYVPFGYGIPCKVPACFYKASKEDSCSPRMRGIAYDIKREDSKLVVSGTCYVPCASLTTFEK